LVISTYLKTSEVSAGAIRLDTLFKLYISRLFSWPVSVYSYLILFDVSVFSQDMGNRHDSCMSYNGYDERPVKKFFQIISQIILTRILKSILKRS